MLIQHYKLLGVGYQSEPDIAPAQWVFESNDSNTLIGFILKVCQETSEVVLFEQQDTSALNIINIHSYLTPNEVAVHLKQAIKDNPKMQEHWEKLFEKIIKN